MTYPRPTKQQITIWFVILITSAGFSFVNFDAFQLGTYGDDAVYVLLARSLVSGDGYGWLSGTGPTPPLPMFPPGFPLLLSPLAILFPNNAQAMKLVSLVATLLNGALLFWGWSRISQRSYWWGLAVSGIYLLSPITIGHSTMVMSEAIFLLIFLIAIMATETAVQRVKQSWCLWPIVASSWILLFTIRTIGIFLIVGFVIYLAIHYAKHLSFRWLLTLSIIATFIVITLLNSALDPDSKLIPRRYLSGNQASTINFIIIWLTDSDPEENLPDWFIKDDETLTGRERLDTSTFINDITERTWGHLSGDLRSSVIPIGGGTSENALGQQFGINNFAAVSGTIFLVLVAIGFIRLLKVDAWSLFLLSALVYILLINLWNWDGTRFYYPVQPQITFAFLTGVEFILIIIIEPFKNKKPALQRLIPAGLAVILILIGLLSLVKIADSENSRDFAGDISTQTEWILANISRSAVVMSERPYVIHLYTGNKTVKQTGDGKSAQWIKQYLMNEKVDLIIIGPELRWHNEGFQSEYSKKTKKLMPVIEELVDKGLLKTVYADNEAKVLIFANVDDQ